MSRQNLLDLIPSTNRDVATFDCTAIASNVLNGGDSLFIPVRRNSSGTLVPYQIRGLHLPRSNAVIECENANVHIRANHPGSWILESLGAATRIHVSGGTWGEKSLGTFRQRRRDRPSITVAGPGQLTTGRPFPIVFRPDVTPPPEGSLTNSTFERMYMLKGLHGFRLESAGGVTLRDLWFNQLAGDCVRFESAEPKGQLSLLTVEGCRFSDWSGVAVSFGGYGTPAQATTNRIVGCWFEATQSTPVGAIRSGGRSYGLTVERCYFEHAATDGPDIELVGEPMAIRSLVIRDNVFQPPRVSQPCRVRSQGNCSFTASGNDVILDDGHDGVHQVFAELNGNSPYSVWLERNLLQYGGPRGTAPSTYEALAWRGNGSQSVEIEEHHAQIGFPDP